MTSTIEPAVSSGPPLGVEGRTGGRPSGRLRSRIRSGLPLLGPAFVAAIAYVDPGNFATNFSAGSRFGYLLLWVIVGANGTAMIIQSLSAKVGLATGQNLPQLSREHFPRSIGLCLWAQAELIAIATDLAEVIGGALALRLLCGLPLLYGGLITGGVAFALLALQSRGARRFEVAIAGLLAIILVAFLINLVRAHPEPAAVAGGLLPRLDGGDSVLLATGILGATVMPHVVYLHSALTQTATRSGDTRSGDAVRRRRLLRGQRVDILLAMGLAGIVNAAMLVIAAAVLPGAGNADTLEGVHAGLDSAMGSGAALLFAVALLVSGLASSGVGTYAGQIMMAGFLRRQIPLLARRGITLAPALGILAIGVDPTRALVMSQVALSFGIPFALVPLILITRTRAIMGELVNGRLMTATASSLAALISALNLYLVWRTIS